MAIQRFIILLVSLFLFSLGWWAGLRWWYDDKILEAETATPDKVAIVFGAAVYSNGRLSGVLRARMDAAIRLYQLGKVDKLLLSGSNLSTAYDEPTSMMNYALSQGVPAAAIQPDFAGRRTYDTCFRARDIFQLESAILVTQDFHLPRALFICNRLGVETTGVAADNFMRSNRGLRWSTAREIPASFLALVDVIRNQPAPVMGNPIPLFE